MSYLFIVDHYIPFPTSECGGIWNVIAEDEEECFDLITADSEEFSRYYGKLRENIQNSRRFLLAEDVESQIVESFTT